MDETNLGKHINTVAYCSIPHTKSVFAVTPALSQESAMNRDKYAFPTHGQVHQFFCNVNPGWTLMNSYSFWRYPRNGDHLIYNLFNLMLQWYPNSTKNADLSKNPKKIDILRDEGGLFHRSPSWDHWDPRFDKLLWGSRPVGCRCPLGSTCRSDAVSPSVEHRTWREPGDLPWKVSRNMAKSRKKPEENGGFMTLGGKESKTVGNFQQTHVGSPEGLLCNHCKNCINLSGSQSVSFYWQLL